MERRWKGGVGLMLGEEVEGFKDIMFCRRFVLEEVSVFGLCFLLFTRYFYIRRFFRDT